MFRELLQEGKRNLKRATSRLRKADQRVLVGLAIVLLTLIVGVIILPKFVYRASESENVETNPVIVEQAEKEYRNPLSGVKGNEPFNLLPSVFAVMIDNHEDAWPISGVENAFLIVEAPVEAGIPRLLAFFSEAQNVDEIGPVRSARPCFIDWNNEFDALYVHVGGSDAALDTIASGGTFDLNQYWWGDYFWRAQDRKAPHNVFTSTSRLADFVRLQDEAGNTPERLFGMWTFKDSEPAFNESAVHIKFDAPLYVVDWEYNTPEGGYFRRMSGKADATNSGKQIFANNVVIVVTDIRVLDEVGRRSVRTTGEGEAWLFQDGRAIEALWRKPSATERLKFYDFKTSEELPMNAGTTWIEVIGSEEDFRIESN